MAIPEIINKKRIETKNSVEWQLFWFTDSESFQVTIEESTTESHLEVWVIDDLTDELIDHDSVTVNTRGQIDLDSLMESVADCLREIGFSD